MTTASLHVRTLRAAFGWAYDQRLLASQSLAGMRGPGQPGPRRDVPIDVVRDLLAAADRDVDATRVFPVGDNHDRRRHRAEQVRLLLRLTADTGARRGELAALHVTDLHDRLVHIDRGVSDEVITTTKTGRSRRLSVGTTTAELWHDTLGTWQQRSSTEQPLGRWLFSPDADHSRRLRAGTVSQWFHAFVRRHGHDGVCLRALRHTVATVLVADGQLIQAQQRLGHAELAASPVASCHGAADRPGPPAAPAARRCRGR
jgi:integrase